MTVTDPTGTDANGGAGRSASLDEAPTFTTSQHLEYLVELTINEWKKTMTKLNNTSADVATMLRVDEMAFYNPDEDSVTKFRVGKVPEVIHHKIDALQHMQRIGLPHLPALVELAKKELAKRTISIDSDEDGDGNETSFAGMVRPQLFGSCCVPSSNMSASLFSSLSLPRTDCLRNTLRRGRQVLI